MNSDRIMVIDEGEIAEMENPQKLIKIESSKFYELWKKYNSEA